MEHIANIGPDPENRKDLIVYANRALLGEIRPNMRKISIQYSKETDSVTLYFYLDQPFSEKEMDYDVSGAIIAELCADFSPNVGWVEKIIVIPFPEIIYAEGTCIYSRFEDFSGIKD